LVNEKFKNERNRVLEEEMYAYHFVGNQITQITSKEEISEIEKAIESHHQVHSCILESYTFTGLFYLRKHKTSYILMKKEVINGRNCLF